MMSVSVFWRMDGKLCVRSVQRMIRLGIGKGEMVQLTTPWRDEHRTGGHGQARVADEAQECEAEATSGAVSGERELCGVDRLVLGFWWWSNEVDVGCERVRDCAKAVVRTTL